ncbi:MAG: WYL domain-containing protein [Acidobacteriota bacterium]|nr:WYL domain-containing protein [Acidobacteriota bacterium]
MARNAEVIRQWTLLRELEGSRTSTIDGLADRTGVSTRTIRRDLIALQEAGFPIYDETLDDGRKQWRLDARPFRSLADNGFTLSELSALYFSRSLVDRQAGLPFHDDLARAFEKIESALSPAVRRFLDHLPDVVGAGPGPAPADDDRQRDIVAKLLEASLHNRQARMRYFSLSSSRAKEYVLHPYRVVYAQGGLYLLAFVPEYKELRTFAIGRVEQLSLLETNFQREATLPDEPFSHSLGVHHGSPEHVSLEFAPQVASFIEGRTWHPSQTLERLDDGRVRLTLQVSVDWALKGWVMSFGPLAKVQAPAALATEIREELVRAHAQYA